MIVAPDSTDVTTYFKLVDSSAGTPETSLTITDLDATYIRDRAAAVKNDLTALAAVDNAHTDNKAIEIDGTNAPGIYRVDWPDAAFANGVARVQLIVNGTSIDPAVIEVELVPWLTAVTGATVKADAVAISGDTTAADNAEAFFDGTGYAGTNNTIPTVTALTNAPANPAGVTELLTRIPDATAGTVGGLPTVDANNYIAGIQGTKNQLDDLNDSPAPDNTGIGNIKAVTDKLDTALVADGGVYQFTANALELAPGTSGDSAGVTELLTRVPDATAGAAGGLAIVGSLMGLTDDAITSAKFDESSAFPLKSADTGATAVARTGADADTLETLSDQIDTIGTSLGTIAPTTDASDSFTQASGTVIAGAYTNTQTDDSSYHTLAPANPGGLDATYVFECGTGRAPTAVALNGYWSGSGQVCDVYAYDYNLGIWDKLTNSSTRLASRSSETNYSYALNREHMDAVTNPGNISIRFVSASTNTAHRLYVDRLLVNTVNDSTGGAGAGGALTAQMVWEYIKRTLTDSAGEAADPEAIADAVLDEALSGHAGAGTTGKTLSDLLTSVGTPVALDSGTASLAGMLTKIADDAGGASFDATNDSLHALQSTVAPGVPQAVTASANTETTGTLIAGTYAKTYLDNADYYTTAPVTPAVSGFGLNIYLTFALATRSPNTVAINGRFAAAALRYCNVYAYNYATASWDQLSDAANRMNHATADANYSYVLLSSHRDPATGNCLIGFMSPSTTTTDRLYLDQVLVNAVAASATATQIADAVYTKLKNTVYEGGIWIDTVNGVAGSVVGTNGTAWNPVSNYADALLLATALGVKRFYLKPGSSITLTQDHTGWRFIGAGTIALGGQAIADAVFEDTYTVSGIGTGDDAHFIDCGIGDVTLAHCYFSGCMFKGTITLTAGDEYHLHNCADAVAAGGLTTLVFAANASAYLRDWRGGVQINGLAATNEVIIDGAGRVVINSDCAGGTLTIRGHFTITDSVVGGFLGTLSDAARWAEDQNITNVTGSVAGLTPGNLDARVSDVKEITDKLNGAMVLDGAVYQFTANALELAPGTSGDSAGVTELLTRIPDATAGAAGGLAIVGSAMNLDDDAITAGKFDESTAFPLKSADTGNTQVARTGADSDTLETLSDQLDAVHVHAADAAAEATTAATQATEANSHAHNLDNRLTAAYGTTEKDAIDLLDDAAGGLADIHTHVVALPTAVQIRQEIDSNSTQLALLITRLGAWTGTGINTILGAFKAMMRKDTAAPSDIGGTYDPTTDSLEAIKDAVDLVVVIGDPLTAHVPGSYNAGEAGWVLGHFGDYISATPPPSVTLLPDKVIVRGDDYLDVDGLAKVITFDVNNALPALIGEVWIEFQDGQNVQTFIVRASGASKQVRYDLTAAQTAAMPRGEMNWILYQLDIHNPEHRRSLTWGEYLVWDGTEH